MAVGSFSEKSPRCLLKMLDARMGLYVRLMEKVIAIASLEKLSVCLDHI